ncbi:MAG: tetratricopeptide repeat protein [bacterium]
MSKHSAVLTVLLATLCCSQSTSAQDISGGGRTGEITLAANASSVTDKSESETKTQSVSPQAIAEAKRLYKLGVKYGRGGLFKQAAELFHRSVELDPNFADAHFGLGHAYYDQGRWEDAIVPLEHAVKINPKDKEGRQMLDEAYVRSGRKTRPSSDWSEQATATVSKPLNAANAPEPKSDTATGAHVSLPAATESSPKNLPSTPIARNELTRTYFIGIGDVLDVRLGNEPESQSTLFTVTPTGLLELPILAEPMQVSGLTLEETKTRLEADLKRRAVDENPRVAVGVREYLSHAIIISGSVKDPGTKLLRREAIPLYVVIADAQPTPEAARATLMRYETGEAILVDLSKPADLNLLVRSGDVITVYPNTKQFFYVGGEVKAPGEIQFRPGLTLTQSILAAGGVIRESKEALVAREGANGFLSTTRYKLKDINAGKVADPLIQSGDRITVEH